MSAVIEHDPGQRNALPTTTTPADLLAMAVNQGADLDKLERLMALQERWEAGESRKAFTTAMTRFRSEPVEIVKSKNVSFSGTNYNHAELSDVTAAINPALAKHDLSFRWDVQQEGNQITVSCVLTHIDGHSERISMAGPPDDSGRKNRIQQIASTVTYLQRYTLLAITGMSTKDMDDDGHAAGGDNIPEQDAAWVRKANEVSDYPAYQKLREAMLKEYGDPDNVPRAVKLAFNQARIETEPKD